MTKPAINVSFAQNFINDIKHLKKKYRHVIDDVDTLVDHLRKGETPGDQIPNVGYNAYKVRLKSSDLTKGKSGGFRIIYYLETKTDRILLTIYVKNEQADISSNEIASLIRKVLSSNN
ncbi:MAG: type II toxin-antitoxin system RelE/ParE family toxin [Chloroflexi bacterium]|nr:type II toxin-antitoxin system RelE/ParE family toxin [Chloroflexota bacterium]MCC6892710.1 type II toxin-antitoxin system RelE/ParE family toxin [Anaerolineae bacterium]